MMKPVIPSFFKPAAPQVDGKLTEPLLSDPTPTPQSKASSAKIAKAARHYPASVGLGNRSLRNVASAFGNLSNLPKNVKVTFEDTSNKDVRHCGHLEGNVPSQILMRAEIDTCKPSDIALLKNMPNLIALRINNTAGPGWDINSGNNLIGSELVAAVAELCNTKGSKLTELDFGRLPKDLTSVNGCLGNYIDVPGIFELGKITGIKKLSLKGSPYLRDDRVCLTDHMPLRPSNGDGNVDRISSMDLESLDLSHCTGVTKLGLISLTKMKNLKTLDLSECDQISWKGFTALESIPGMQNLSLGGCNINDKSMAYLKNLTNMRSLDLQDTYLSAEGVRQMIGMEKLHTLNMSGCKAINDDALAEVAKLPMLETLHLESCPGITDLGIQHLLQMSHLKQVIVDGCPGVSDTGRSLIAKLASAN